MKTRSFVLVGSLFIVLLLSASGIWVAAQGTDSFTELQVDSSLRPSPTSETPVPARTNVSTLTVADYVLDSQEIPTSQLSTETAASIPWTWQHGSHAMHDLHFFNTDKGWAVSDYGLIVRTDDGGQSWETLDSGVSNWLGDVQFVDANTGWAVGSAGTILHTTDGGLTWQMQSGAVSVDLYGLFFLDDQKGWIGLPDGVLRTTDGGSTWVKTGTGVTVQVRDLQFFDANNGVLASKGDDPGDGEILLTSDGGETWTPANCDDDFLPCSRFRFLLALHFPNASFGVAVGGWVNPDIFITNDGGANWSNVDTGFSFVVPDSVYFVDTEYGWAIDDGDMLRSTDGGQTWSKQSGGGNDIQFLTRTQGFMATTNGIKASTDGGATWSTPDDFAPTTLRGVSFVNTSVMSSTQGWAVGSGTILHTTDGGDNWAVQWEDSSYLRSVYFVNRMLGWAVGNEGRILTTGDGGSTWIGQTALTDYHLYDVHFVDETYGWIAGKEDSNINWDGKVWRTTDGGANWAEVGYFTGYQQGAHGKYGIDFVDRNVGYVVGIEVSNGSVHKTTDSGETWTLILGGEQYPILNDVDFINANEGWVVGRAGAILHTSDGGSNWEVQISNTSVDLQAVSFLGSQIGYTVGSRTILKTTDGGLTWTPETTGISPYGPTVYDISSPNPYQAWVAGSSGMIRAYTAPDTGCITPAAVALSGPDTGGINTDYTFTATVNPTATTPIAYAWSAGGETPIVYHGSGLSDTVTFSWSTTGEQTVVITAANPSGIVTNTHIINVQSNNIFLPLVIRDK